MYAGVVNQRAIDDASVTVVGIGDVRLAIADARGIDPSKVLRAVHEALELGITLVDSSEEPEAERLCGDAVRALRLRDRVILATRVAVLAERPGAPGHDALPERLPVSYVQERIEASLRATRLDALPLAQLPVRSAWQSSSAWPELAGACARLVREGKVLRWGAMLQDASAAPNDEELEGARRLADPFATVHARFGLCDRRTGALIDHPSKLPVLARAPLAGGALTGTLGPGATLSPRDDRRAIDAATLERIAVGIAKLAPLVRHEPPAARSCDAARAVLEQGRRPQHVEASSTAELALRYVIDRGAIALPRLHHREHIAEAIAAASAPPLSPELLATLDEIFGAARDS